MNEVIRFALLGLGVGALYAFASQGLIVIYRGTGVLNFSLGATAIAGVFLQYELQYEHGHNFWVASFFGISVDAPLLTTVRNVGVDCDRVSGGPKHAVEPVVVSLPARDERLVELVIRIRGFVLTAGLAARTGLPP